MNINQFPWEVYPALRDVIYEEYDANALVYPKITVSDGTDKYYEEETTEVGIGLFSETGDGEDYHEDTNFQGFYTRYNLAKFTSYFRVSEDLMEFERYNTMGRRSRDLGNKANVTEDTLVHLVYNNGFTTVLSDGQPLFSVNHPGYPGSGAKFANVLATQSALSYTSFNSVLTAIKRQTDERGTLIRMRPAKLVVAPENELTAREILKSTGRPDTADRADNELKKMAAGIELVVDPYLNSPSMWFVICDRFFVKAFTHGGLTTKTKEDPFNGDWMVFGRFYLAYGASSPWGVFAGSA